MMFDAKNLTVIFTVAKEDEHFLDDKLANFSDYPIVISRTIGLGKARRECIDKVSTEYVLVLDLDNVLPDQYIEDAIMIMKADTKIAVIALDYEECIGHYGFGTSLWKGEMLKKLYDYQDYKGELCECCYLYRKVLQNKYKIETLPYRAIHNKGSN